MADKFTQTVTPQAQGGAGQLADISQEQQVRNVWESALGLQKAAVGAVEQITEEKIKELELSGSMKALEVNAQRQNMDPEEADELYSKEQEDYMNGTSDMSEAEAKAYFQNTLQQATQFKNKATEIRTDRNVMVETNLLTNKIQDEDFDALSSISELSSKYGVTKQKVRDSFIIGKSQRDLNMIDGADNPESLKIVKEFIELENSKLNIPELLLTQSKGQSGVLVNQYKSDMAKALKVKEAMFKTQATDRTIAAEGNTNDIRTSYNAIPNDQLKSDYITRYGVEKGKIEYEKYSNEFIQNEKRKLTLDTVPVTDMISDELLSDKKLKEARTKQVSDSLDKDVKQGSMDHFNETAIANPKIAADVGSEMMKKLNNAETSDGIKATIKSVISSKYYKNGSTAMSTLYKDTDVERMYLIDSAAQLEVNKTDGKPDYLKARSWVDMNKSQITDKSNLEKDIWEYVEKNSKGLGEDAGRFKTMITRIASVNRDLITDDLIKNIREDILSTKQEVGNGIYDTSNGIIQEQYTKDLGENYLVKSYLEDEQYSKASATIQGDLILYDKLGGQVKIVSRKELEEKEAELANKFLKSEPDTELDKAVKRLSISAVQTTSEVVDEMGTSIGKMYDESLLKKTVEGVSTGASNVGETIGKIGSGLSSSFGKMFDKLGDHIYSNIVKDINSMAEMFSSKAEAAEPKELFKDVVIQSSINALENKKEKLVIKDPMEGSNHKRNELENIQVQGAIETNKVTAKKIDIAIKQLRKQVSEDVRPKLLNSISVKEGGYSSDKNDKGNYYNDKFVGTNHGISAPILAEYLNRTPTVEDMKGLSKEKAQEILWNRYYEKKGLENLPNNLQEIVFHGVVTGEGHAIKVMQELIGVKTDGSVGPKTIEAMKKAKFTKKEFKDALLKKYKTFPDWKSQGKGWTNRFEDLAK